MQVKLIVQVTPAWWKQRTPVLVTRAVDVVRNGLAGVELVTVSDDGLCVVVAKPEPMTFGAYDGIFRTLQSGLDVLS